MYGWRVLVEHNYNFARDSLNLRIVFSDGHGNTYGVKPWSIEKTDEPLDPNTTTDELPEPAEIHTELAVALFNALGRLLVGEGDMLEKIHRLERELATANNRVDNLIAGIGHLGGRT